MLQRVAAVAAMVTASVALAMVTRLAQNTDTTKNYLGGLNFNQLIFNYHPVLMVAGLVFCSVWSLLAYRVVPAPKFARKVYHIAFHTAAVVCIGVGLNAVIQGNNDPNKNTGGTYYPNLYSLHSFIGIIALILYLQNYLFGFLYFITSWISLPSKRRYRPNHVLFGILGLFVSAMAVATGLMELATENSCQYVSFVT
jgi:hypothetical protein